MSIPSRVRKKIAAGEPVFTAKACYADPEVVELLASSGFDAIWICLEHKRLDPAMVYSLIQACRLGGADALMRVRPSNYTDLLWLLEAGARGLMIPRMHHPDEARALVSAAKFPPLGQRGCDAIHPDCNMGRTAMPDYVSGANADTFLVVQIEEPDVVAHVDEIAAMPGVDVLFVGPGDLSLSYGQPGKFDAPEVQAAILAVAEACRKHGKSAAIPCGADQVKKYRTMGYSFFNIFSDYRGVNLGAKQALEAVR